MDKEGGGGVTAKRLVTYVWVNDDEGAARVWQRFKDDAPPEAFEEAYGLVEEIRCDTALALCTGLDASRLANEPVEVV